MKENHSIKVYKFEDQVDHMSNQLKEVKTAIKELKKDVVNLTNEISEKTNKSEIEILKEEISVMKAVIKKIEKKMMKENDQHKKTLTLEPSKKLTNFREFQSLLKSSQYIQEYSDTEMEDT